MSVCFGKSRISPKIIFPKLNVVPVFLFLPGVRWCLPWRSLGGHEESPGSGGQSRGSSGSGWPLPRGTQPVLGFGELPPYGGSVILVAPVASGACWWERPWCVPRGVARGGKGQWTFF